jgi:hypothetical protein
VHHFVLHRARDTIHLNFVLHCARDTIHHFVSAHHPRIGSARDA